jgi:hypothetical protein
MIEAKRALLKYVERTKAQRVTNTNLKSNTENIKKKTNTSPTKATQGRAKA